MAGKSARRLWHLAVPGSTRSTHSPPPFRSHALLSMTTSAPGSSARGTAELNFSAPPQSVARFSDIRIEPSKCTADKSSVAIAAPLLALFLSNTTSRTKQVACPARTNEPKPFVPWFSEKL
eukprot:717909-Rhodomonas_salina.1